jgi:hypothetical protein
MVTKIFQGPKNIVEEQLASYTSSLSSVISISLSTTVVEAVSDSLPRVIYLTVIIAHPKTV